MTIYNGMFYQSLFLNLIIHFVVDLKFAYPKSK